MSEELQMIAGNDGVAVIGDRGVIDRFITANELVSREFPVGKLRHSVSLASGATEAAATISAQSGRWIKLTEESARALKYGEAMAGSEKGLMRAILTKDSKISQHLEFIKDSGDLLTSPAFLTGAAGVMAQMAMQQTIDEIADYLAKIDEKCDDILRAQKDAVLSEMIGTGIVLDDAMLTWTEVGTVSEVTWSTVQTAPQVIAQTQVYALKQIQRLAEKIEAETDIGNLSDILREGEADLEEWLVVLARSFQLQETVGVLTIGRVLDAHPEQVEDHQRAVKLSRQRRLDEISSSTAHLVARINHAAQLADRKLLFNPIDSPRVIRAGSKTKDSIELFHSHIGLDDIDSDLEKRRWIEAVADARDQAITRGAEGFDAAKRLGADGVGAARQAGTGGFDVAKRLGGGTVDQAKSLGRRFGSRVASRLPRGTKDDDLQQDSEEFSTGE